MGCGKYNVKDIKLGEIEDKLKECFCTQNFNKFLYSINRLQILKKNDFNINTYKVHCFYDLDLTIPSLCIIYGRLNYFQYIKKYFEVSLASIEETLNSFKVSSLFFLCSKNYPEFLKYYLPLYIENYKKFVSIETFSLVFEDIQQPRALTEHTPIQIACQKGHMNILNIIFEFFKDASFVPAELDMHRVNNYTGETCALIACRECNYSLVKFLFANCNCDFSIVNFKGESALQLACKGHQCNKSQNLLIICKFLIEEVLVDPAYNYKKTLNLCEDKETYSYLTGKLSALGLEIPEID